MVNDGDRRTIVANVAASVLYLRIASATVLLLIRYLIPGITCTFPNPAPFESLALAKLAAQVSDASTEWKAAAAAKMLDIFISFNVGASPSNLDERIDGNISELYRNLFA